MSLVFSNSQRDSALNGVKAIVYGESEAGKTMLLATAPGVLIATAEKGLLSLRPANLARIYPDAPRNLKTVAITKDKDLRELLLFMRQSAHAKEVLTLGFDSLSEIAEILLAEKMKTIRDGRQAYGAMQMRLAEFMREFRDLPGKHIIYNALTEAREYNGVTRFGPSVPGQKFSPKIPGIVDEVFRLGVRFDASGKRGVRYIQTASDEEYLAKDRSGSLSAEEKPNLAAIFDKIAQT